MRCKNLLKFHEKTWEKVFEIKKYISPDGCFVKKTKQQTMNCDNNDDLFPDIRAFAFTRQPMKQNFT